MPPHPIRAKSRERRGTAAGTANERRPGGPGAIVSTSAFLAHDVRATRPAAVPRRSPRPPLPPRPDLHGLERELIPRRERVRLDEPRAELRNGVRVAARRRRACCGATLGSTLTTRWSLSRKTTSSARAHADGMHGVAVLEPQVLLPARSTCAAGNRRRARASCRRGGRATRGHGPCSRCGRATSHSAVNAVKSAVAPIRYGAKASGCIAALRRAGTSR